MIVRTSRYHIKQRYSTCVYCATREMGGTRWVSTKHCGGTPDTSDEGKGKDEKREEGKEGGTDPRRRQDTGMQPQAPTTTARHRPRHEKSATVSVHPERNQNKSPSGGHSLVIR